MTTVTTNAETQKLHHATFDGDIKSLLDQIDQGLREDDANNFEKLSIARKYGALLLQLKAVVPHGQFKQVLKERFPRTSYSKCNRWMVIARHEAEVAKALADLPDVAWGPKKMIDYLTQEWRPESDATEDEEDCWGCVSEEATEATFSFEATVDDPELEINVEDASGGDDDRSKWETLAATAESEALLIGLEPAIPSKEGTVIVTVFSDHDHDAVADALAEWQPKKVPVLGHKSISNLTVTVSPDAISAILMKLGKTLKKTLPSQLKVSIEV